MSEAAERVIIVGAGQGGLQAAISLRQEGFEGSVTLIGSEPGLPYQRPPLSKAFLKTGEADALTLRPAAFLEKNAIGLMAQTTVTDIDRKAKRLSAGGRQLAYDHLVLATGTRNVRPPISGLEQALDLRTLEDAERLRAALKPGRRVAVIGGGFIGLEFAAVARELGHDVTVVEAAPRLLARAVSPDMSERFFRHHLALGTNIVLNEAVREVQDLGLKTSGNRIVEADLVLVAAGVRPNVELAQACGLTVDNGIVVDRFLRTSDPDIYALGDCAAFPDPVSGKLVRLESVQAATDHARLVAKQIVGNTAAPYAAVPWFWSDQADWKLQIAGLAEPEDESVAVGESAVFRFRNGWLTAVETVNGAKTHMLARKVLAAPDRCPRDRLEQTRYDLSSAIDWMG